MVELCYYFHRIGYFTVMVPQYCKEYREISCQYLVVCKETQCGDKKILFKFPSDGADEIRRKYQHKDR